MSCTTGDKCYSLVGDGYNEEYCAETSTCSFSATITYEVFPCATDMTGTRCTDNTCVGTSGVDVCW